MLDLVVTIEAVSSTLMREDNGHQLPIYYISKALLAVKNRYPDIEKPILALITISRKLSPHFQGHTIEVLTNFPLKQVLKKPNALEMLLK